jgi:hypothetical protein
MEKPINTGRNPDGTFKKGFATNPAGKPKGARHKSTMAAMALLQGEAQALTRVCIDKALEGDLTALKLCLDRIIPPSKDHPVDIVLPTIRTLDDLPGFTAELLDAVATGRIGATEAEKICKISTAHVQAVQLSTFEQRLSDLESAIRGTSK